MKELKLFLCDYCGTQYKERNECKVCEDGHNTPKEIVDAKYVSIKNNNNGYPTQITVKMSNGETIIYKR